MMDSEIDSEDYLLVSDSNETSQQFDSKKLSHRGLSGLAQDELFKKYLDMSMYLKIGRYEMLCQGLEQGLQDLNSRFIDDPQWSGKYRVVDGQVILLRKSELDVYNESQGTETSPLDYIKQYWDITSEFQVNQITDCMLCGVGIPFDGEQFTQVQHSGKQTVTITDENFPNHMHHSGVTSQTKVYGLGVDFSSSIGIPTGQVRYDVLNNDYLSTGVENSGLEGVVDKFEVKECGDSNLVHNNLPSYEKFYAFEVRKVLN